MSLFSEFDLFRRSVHQLFSEFERDYLNDRYLLDTHFADYPLMQNDNDNDNNNNMQLENQNTQDATKVTNNNNKTKSNNNNANTGTNNQLQSRGGTGGGLMNTRPSASTAALLFSPWSNPLSLRSLPQSSCRMDVIEKSDHYEVHAELAGIPKENIKIEVVDGLLTLSGEHRSQIEQKSSPPANNNEKENNQNDTKDNQGHYHYRERSYSSVKRSLRLPENIDTEKIAAKYDNGLLRLTLPKKEIVPPNPINVQIA